MSRDIRAYSVVSNAFRFGFLVMARSLLAQNPHHRVTFVVVHHPELSALDEEYRHWLQSQLPNIEFRVPELEDYRKIFRLRDEVFRTPKRLWAAFFILEAFRDDFEGEVLSLDSDMICMGQLEDDLFDGPGFKAVEALSPRHVPLGFFNTGVMSIGREHRGKEAFQRLMTEADASRYNQKAGRADQALLNLFYSPANATCLPWRYNMTRRHVPPVGVEEFLRERGAVFFHYVGEKPWHVSLDRRDLRGLEAEQLWDRVVKEVLTPEAYVRYLEE
jgi:hypothetical protein